jgi:hypothetical protein
VVRRPDRRVANYPYGADYGCPVLEVGDQLLALSLRSMPTSTTLSVRSSSQSIRSSNGPAMSSATERRRGNNVTRSSGVIL